MALHMLKLAVGVSDLDHLGQVQRRWLRDHDGRIAMPVFTKRPPRRAEEVLNGGSMYRVIKNVIQCRQEIWDIEHTHDEADGDHCLIWCNPEIIRVDPTPKRAFQGWRYLEASSAPRDIGAYHVSEDRPPKEIEFALRAISML